ncbi:MAG: sel1 repeat family protein [Elusimicrobia bacterium]|nr:sel1 repeat family protein [Elusimicrobiota bacterium]
MNKRLIFARALPAACLGSVVFLSNGGCYMPGQAGRIAGMRQASAAGWDASQPPEYRGMLDPDYRKAQQAHYQKNDLGEAERLYKALAEKGNNAARYALAQLYLYQRNAKGVQGTAADGVRISREMADEGMAGAMSLLSFAYENGLGTEEDPDEALKWERKVYEAQRGNRVLAARCQTRIKRLEIQAALKKRDWDAERGEAIASLLPDHRGPVLEADAHLAAGRVDQGRQVLEASASKGNATARYLVAKLYAMGVGFPKDESRSREWLRAAAEGGDVSAQMDLGDAYMLGEGVEKDHDAALRWYKKAVDQGDVQSLGRVCQLLYDWGAAQKEAMDAYKASKGRKAYQVKPPFPEALSCYRSMAKHGDQTAALVIQSVEMTREMKAAAEEAKKRPVASSSDEGPDLSDSAKRLGRTAGGDKGADIAESVATGIEIAVAIYKIFKVYKPKGEKASGVADEKDWDAAFAREAEADRRARAEERRKAGEAGEAAYQEDTPWLPERTGFAMGCRGLAFGFYDAMARRGEPSAQAALGAAYSMGHGVRKDARTSMEWLRKAAQGGDKDAQCSVGNSLLFGWGQTRADPIEGYKWMKVSGPTRSCQRTLDFMGDDLGVTPEDKAEAERRAADFKPVRSM